MSRGAARRRPPPAPGRRRRPGSRGTRSRAWGRLAPRRPRRARTPGCRRSREPARPSAFCSDLVVELRSPARASAALTGDMSDASGIKPSAALELEQTNKPREKSRARPQIDQRRSHPRLRHPHPLAAIARARSNSGVGSVPRVHRRATRLDQVHRPRCDVTTLLGPARLTIATQERVSSSTSAAALRIWTSCSTSRFHVLDVDARPEPGQAQHQPPCLSHRAPVALCVSRSWAHDLVASIVHRGTARA